MIIGAYFDGDHGIWSGAPLVACACSENRRKHLARNV